MKKAGRKEEPPREEKKRTGFTGKPSAKLMVKTANPFAPKQRKGGVPCRIQHGSVNMKLQWDMPPSQLNYDPLLITCFEGLLETEHPYKFVAREAARELLQADGAAEKSLPLLQRLIMPLRMALMSADKDVFSFGLDVLKTLSELLGPNLNQYLHLLLQQLGKKLTDRNLRDKIFEVLACLEDQGGEEVLPLIKAKIPTYRT